MNIASTDFIEMPATKENYINTTLSSLERFLLNWDMEYKNSIKNIKLFNPSLVKQWTNAQKQYFVRVFYHSRGHFRDLLWYLGNFAPDKESKDIILHNIAEEFNGNYLSHEQLYLDYAKSMGVDLKNEFLDRKFYLSKMYIFNESHLRWAVQHDWNHCFSAFSAYERLDTADYTFLANIQEVEHEFFIIHKKAKHFEETSDLLKRIWENDKQAVVEAFKFIATTQAKMWKNLSDTVFAYDQQVERSFKKVAA